jgi:hypothetical protein
MQNFDKTKHQQSSRENNCQQKFPSLRGVWKEIHTATGGMGLFGKCAPSDCM